MADLVKYFISPHVQAEEKGVRPIAAFKRAGFLESFSWTKPGSTALTMCFGKEDNIVAKVITFEVVGFEGRYDADLGRPALVQFGAVVNHARLQLKILGPKGALVIDGSLSVGASIDWGASRIQGPEESTADYACHLIREANWPAHGPDKPIIQRLGYETLKSFSASTSSSHIQSGNCAPAAIA